MKRKAEEQHTREPTVAQPADSARASDDSWPDPPTFEALCRVVQERLAGPEHDARIEQLRRHEERWAAMSEQERRACFPDDLVGMIDDPSFPRSDHLHEDLYGEGKSE